MAYMRLSRDERVQLEALWRTGLTLAAIARELGRHRSTVTRELQRHGLYRFAYGSVNARSRALTPSDRGLYARSYCAAGAHERAQRRAKRTADGRLVTDLVLRKMVCDMLRERWSPRQVAQRLRFDHPDRPELQVSHETIYQALYLQGRGNLRAELADQVALRSGRKRRQRRPEPAGAVRSARAWTTDLHISSRPAEAADRAVPGHWEGDLVIGARGSSAIITCVERSTRFVLLGALPDSRSSGAVITVLSELITRLPQELRRSLAWDNGSEMARHAEFSVATGCPVYFCDPHSPWQRGSNENTNGLLRQYFPRRATNFRDWNQDALDAVARQLNGRPRETLGWHTPAEALNAHLVALAA
jgi:IS30 family transposase